MQIILSQVAFAAKLTTEDTFAVKASNALARNDFSDLENGSATFNYSDNSKVYVKVSDLTVDTTASDGSTSTVSMGKQYEVCSVSSDSRAVSCNYTTVRQDGSKDTKSLDLDNTQEHQIYSIPSNATYTDSDKKYFVTSYDNPYYKFRSIDENGHISGTNCIKLNSNSMVCSATADIDMSKLSASDFQQDSTNTEKYQINRDKLTNATLATSDGACSIDGWVQADATHCCPPNTDTYSYEWDTAQQQCKVTKHNQQKGNKNNLLKNLLSAGAIFAGSMQGGKDKQTQQTRNPNSTTELSEDMIYQDANIDKNAQISIKFNPTIPVLTDELKATIKVKSTDSDELIVRIKSPNNDIDTINTKSNEEFLLIQKDKIQAGRYKLVVYVMNKNIRKATFEASFEVFDEVTVLSDEQKKQITEIHPTQISEDIEQFSIAGDVSNVRYDEENSICSFDLNNSFAQANESEAFKIEQSIPVEMSTDKQACEDLKDRKIYISEGLLHKDGDRLGVVVDENSFLLTNADEVYFGDSNAAEFDAEFEAFNRELGDVSTIQTPAGTKVVSISYADDGTPFFEDTASGDIYYSLSDFADANDIDADTLSVAQYQLSNGTVLSRLYVNDDTTKDLFVKDMFNAKVAEIANTSKKASRISDFTINSMNTVEIKKENKTQQSNGRSGRSVGSCIDDFNKEIQKEIKQQVDINIALLEQIFDT